MQRHRGHSRSLMQGGFGGVTNPAYQERCRQTVAGSTPPKCHLFEIVFSLYNYFSTLGGHPFSDRSHCNGLFL